MRRRLAVTLVVLLALTASAAARPELVIIDQDVEPGVLTPQGLIPYNTIYLNRCAGGCNIGVGPANAINNTWQVGSPRVLTAFPYGDMVWQQVVSCVKDVFEPFNVNIVEANPGTVNHFEIMIAGSPTDVGMNANIGGVAPGSSSCSGYVNNALVFDFAKVWGNGTNCNASCVEDICATAAQEIGHVWQRMDHVIEPKDPMTYFGYAGRKYFQNTAAQCGSDCVQGQGPNGQTCTGTNNQNHSCYCGGSTQNSYNIVTGLFGAGPGSPPTVTINRPKQNQSVDAGFVIDAMAMDNSGTITKVEVVVDGQLVTTKESSPSVVIDAPTTLAMGSHKVEVIAYDPHGTAGKTTVDVMIGPPCGDSSDCSEAGDVCVGGRCVPGSSVDGGLGTSCTMNDDCASGKCASDGTAMYCVELCAVGDCPSGFGCLDSGNMQSVCWPGFDDGSGGCGCQSSRGGPLGMMVLLGWLVLTCRRRARS